MLINNIPFAVELEDIITELQTQLHLNHIKLLNKIHSIPGDVMITCPYHKGGQERKPSAGISKVDGTFHCFSCGETHSLQEVISHCFGHDEIGGMWGWNWLLKTFLTIDVEERKDIEIDYLRNRSHVNSEKSYVKEEELDSYRYTHPYMYKRKLTDEIIELFDIGYDKKTECITFPIRDISGNTLFIARRSVKTKFFNYPQGAEKPLYGLYEWHKTNDGFNMRDSIIVCESMLDALTCWVYGKRAVALNGLGNDLQFNQLRELPCRKLILATDNDDAGNKARKRIRNNITNKIITEYILPPDKKDLNELTAEEFENLEELF